MVKKTLRFALDPDEQVDPQVTTKRYMTCEKYVYMVIICVTHLAFGITFSAIGPALVDLKYILNTEMDKISFIIIFQAAGHMVGALSGVLYKYINRQLLLTVLLSLMAFCVLLMPFSQRLWHLYLYNWIYGFGSGAWINAKNVWIIELFSHKSAPVLQLCGLMFGVGSVLGPLIDDPYLTGYVDHSAANSTWTQIEQFEEQRRHKLRSPFIISASVQLVGPCLLIIMYFLRKYEKFDHKYEPILDEQDVDRKTRFKRQKHLKPALVALGSLFLAFHMSSEQNTQLFAATYFQDISLKLTASESAEVVSAMFLANTIGLAVSVVVSARLRPQYMIGYHLLIIFAALNVLFLVASKLHLYVGSLLLSFGYSAIYPSVFAYIAHYIDITDKLGTILMVASDGLNLFVPYLIGLYIEHFTPIFLLAIAFNLAIETFVFIFMLQLINKYCT